MDSKGVSIETLDSGYKQRMDRKEIKILCFDLTESSQKMQLLWCSAGVFAFYLLYGYLQELIFTLDGFRPFGWYLTLIQFTYYSIFGWIEYRMKGVTRRIPLGTYLLLALLTLGTMGFSNSSLGYLNYPTQVIFKCCKLVPVLIGSILIQGKKYGLLDFLAAILMCIGLASFTLADSMISPRFDTIGVMMISCALLCDAVIGNLQEKAMKQHKATNTEVVLFSYSIGFLYLFFILLVTRDLQKGAAFCAEHPMETYGYGLLFSASGYLGIQIVLTLVQSCGAFVAATVTTCRKAITILISFLFFYKPFTFQYVWSGLLVLLGIYLNVYSKKRGADAKGGLKELWIGIQRCWIRHNRIQRRLLINV
ncbi:adenosine 3'-phospho 5'-phosphosulfate transporter 2 [Athalia rosae]|uniref:adenosine 3'-phospho 5'-phosphosulfate transporter 2 n=1 Tax=Athalia rosae TaxID=37344 RepID=UPI002033A581|nr:adenosine 3'-phospho 5'-phosphosulfate transporter 2 [Athalia rosae]XP_048507226.1 adenosine 3'-phospho 5'-phosphosulfate transporter 2 [Athalia rosae]XP_048507227.1 adenosine 3'-phospho 5'-phosphosulfate transporter 2 [Athalia rosae]